MNEIIFQKQAISPAVYGLKKEEKKSNGKYRDYVRAIELLAKMKSKGSIGEEEYGYLKKRFQEESFSEA